MNESYKYSMKHFFVLSFVLFLNFYVHPEGQLSKDIVLRLNLSKKNVYVDEPVILSLKIFISKSRPFKALEYDLPDLSSFKSEASEQKEYTRVVNGKKYKIFDIQTTLYPSSVGEIVISSAFVSVQLMKNQKAVRKSDAFDGFFGAGSEFISVKKSSNSCVLTVKRVPESGNSEKLEASAGHDQLHVLNSGSNKVHDDNYEGKSVHSNNSRFLFKGYGLSGINTSSDILKSRKTELSWNMFVLLILGMTLFYGLLKRMISVRKKNSDPVYRRNKKAKSVFYSKFKKIKKQNAKKQKMPKELCYCLNQIVCEYLSDKLNLANGVLTVLEVEEHLSQINIPLSLKNDFKLFIDTSNQFQFSPENQTGLNSQRFLIECEKMINDFESLTQ